MPAKRTRHAFRRSLELLFVSVGLIWCSSAAAAPAIGPQQFGARPPSAVSRQSGPIHPAVCRIVAPGKGSISFGSGTLVDVSEHYGLVITNWHVINESTGQLWVMFPDGFQSPGAIQKVDRDWDLAAIAVFRPNAEPVKVSAAAARPGELLTIAGYGSGDYRAVSGKCTQYVAPGLKFPYEMVELAATARQGDSGGPIFNDRGELAGVLFGAGGGRTSGSYSGRVQWFLSSLGRPADGSSPVPAMIAQAPPQQSQELSPAHVAFEKPAPPPSVIDLPLRVAAHTPHQQNQVQPAQPRAESAGTAPAASLARNNPTSVGRTAQPVASTQRYTVPSVGSDPAKLPAASVQTVNLADMLGPTPADQLKTILAGVGLLALLIKTIAWLTAQPPKPKKAARA